MVLESDITHLISETSEAQQDHQCSDSLDNVTDHLQSPPSSEDEQEGVCGRVVRELKLVTVEPLLFLFITGWMVQASVTTNLLLAKVCREHQYDEDTCNNLSSHTKAQIAVQEEVNTINMYVELITNIPGVLLVLFIGSWSDKHGRKVPMMLPVFGSFLSTLLYLGNSYWMELPSLYILLAPVPFALTGGLTTLLMACYSYIADITKVYSRTMRIAFLDLGFALGPMIGLLCSDVLFYKTGYLGVYSVSGLFFLLAFGYGTVRIEDTRGPLSKYQLQPLELSQQPRDMCRDLFDTDNVRDTFKTVIKPRPNKGRAKILFLIATLCSILFIFASSNLDFLYTKRKFGWDYDQYIHLNLTHLLISFVGTIIVLPLFSFRLGVHDALLGLVGCLSAVAGNLIRGFAPYPCFLFLSYVVSCVGGIPLVITRSMISKCVPEEELGKVFSVLASGESVIPLLSSPLYTFVYNASIVVFPGAPYILSAVFYTFAEVVYIWMYHNRKPPPATDHIHEDDVPVIES